MAEKWAVFHCFFHYTPYIWHALAKPVLLYQPENCCILNSDIINRLHHYGEGNMKHRRWTSLLLALAVIITLLYPMQTSAAVKINKTKTTVVIGKTKTLKVTGTSKKVKWSSSNKSIVTVNSKGKITGKKAGTATIKAKVGNKTYKCKVTVIGPKKAAKLVAKYVQKKYPSATLDGSGFDEGSTILFVGIKKGKNTMTVRLNLKTAEATFDSTNKKQYFPKLPDTAKIWK